MRGDYRPPSKAPYMYAAGNVVVTTNASGRATISFGRTFPAVPTVTAIGGNVWGQMFQNPTVIEMNMQPPTTIRIELDDGTVETFVATSQQDFRGFVSTRPIHAITFGTPLPGDDGEYVWGVFDNLVVGNAR